MSPFLFGAHGLLNFSEVRTAFRRTPIISRCLTLAITNVGIEPRDRLQNPPQPRNSNTLRRREASVRGQSSEQILFDLLRGMVLVVRVRLAQLAILELGAGFLVQRATQPHPHELPQRVRHTLATNHLLELLAATQLAHVVPAEGLPYVRIQSELKIRDPLQLVLAVLHEQPLIQLPDARHVIQTYVVECLRVIAPLRGVHLSFFGCKYKMQMEIGVKILPKNVFENTKTNTFQIFLEFLVCYIRGLFFFILMEHRLGRGGIKNGPKIKID